MTSQVRQVGIVDVVREVVAQLAPQELPVVDGLTALGSDTAFRRLTRARMRTEPLGFGLGDVVVVITPVVWAAMEHVANRLADSATDGIANRIKRLLRRRNSVPRAVQLPLSPAHLAEVRRKALEIGARQGLTAEQSEAIADAIVARLALDSEPE